MTKGSKLNQGIFEGETINTLDALRRGLSRHPAMGEIDRRAQATMARADANAKTIADWVAVTPWIEFLADDPTIRSNTSVCLKVVDPAVQARRHASGIHQEPGGGAGKEGVAYDIDATAMRRPACASGAARPSSARRRGAYAVARLGLREEQGRRCRRPRDSAVHLSLSPASGCAG
jgi:hypothetical protein